MKTEIEKLYENVGIEKKRMCEWTCRGNEFCSTNCEHYESTKEFYPPFTAEKQLELIKWLAIRFNPDYMTYWHNGIKDVWIFRLHDLTEFSSKRPYVYESRNKNFAKALCNLINDLWQSLPEQEQEEIRRILE